jgi:hypothetical protein
MQAKCIFNFRVFLIGLIVLSVVCGCSTLDRKLEDSTLTRKMWDWQKALNKKLSSDTKESSSSESRSTTTNQEASQTYFEHQIRWPGESLSLISKWYTGKYKNWTKLVAHNPQIDPKRIRIGQRILIPEDMLTTRDPLPQKVAAKFLPGYFAYTVRHPGETMIRIARWYTGDSENWKALAAANPDLDPELLVIGHEVYIPPDLLKTREPPPQSDETSSEPGPPKKPQPAEPAAVPNQKQEIQLFGPKPFPKG